MAQLQIPIDDELMRKLKMFAADNGTTLKQLVPDILNRHFTPTDDAPNPMLVPKLSTIPKKPKKVELDMFDRPILTPEEREAEIQRMINTSNPHNPLE